MQDDNPQPTGAERVQFSIHAYKGIELGLGKDEPAARIAAKLETAYPDHLILIQTGTFLHGYNRTAHALHTLKGYKIQLVGTALEPHIRAGFPLGGYRRRLWPMVKDFGIPYVVSLGSKADGREVFVSENSPARANILAAVSATVVADTIHDLQQRDQVNRASAAKALATPETGVFKLKACAQDLDTLLLQDILAMPRDLRSTYGENVRACMSRVMNMVFKYGQAEDKLATLRTISADVDQLKHYLVQALKLRQLKFSTEHRVGLAVELGKLVGGLLKTAGAKQ